MIEFSAEQIKKAEMLLGDIREAIPKVQARAINRSLTTARAAIVRAVREEYMVDADAVRKTITIRSATAATPTGIILSAGSPIALSKFDVGFSAEELESNGFSAVEGVSSKHVLRARVLARVKKNSSRKVIKHAFSADLKSGHNGIFVRAGKSRFPIKQLYGPSVPQMIGSKSVSKQIEEKASVTLEKRLDHEINRVLEGHL